MTAADVGREDPKFPLEVFFCNRCAHLQLLDVVDPKLLFEDYVYVSGTSAAFVNHFKDYAETMTERMGLSKGDLVVDIGSNDGTLLRFFKERGMRVLGVDPAKQIAEQATRDGIPTLATFFDEQLTKRIRDEHGEAAIVTANNVFAHVDDLDGFTRAARSLLAPEGAFVFEVSYLVDVYEKTLFDTIYHEHLDYHTVRPLIEFFRKHQMELVSAERVPTHGGSLRGVARIRGHVEESVSDLVSVEEDLGLDRGETLREFEIKINKVGEELRSLLTSLKSKRSSIAGFGAPAKATTLMHHFEIGPDLIDFIVDDSPLKQGLFTPGYHVPVLHPDELTKRQPDYLLILAWNFADQIIERHKDFGGKFIVPLPTVKTVE